MRIMKLQVFSVIAWAMMSLSTHADMRLGAKYYKNGEMDKAYKEFKLASAYGDANAQYNLAAMYYRGQHVEKSLTQSYAWFALAASNGNPDAGNVATKLYGQLSDELKLQADADKQKLLSEYSQNNVLDALSPELSMGSVVNESYKVVRRVAPEYPRSLLRRGVSGWADVIFTIAEDGSTRDHTILYSSNKRFDTPAIQAVRGWLYEPRTIQGEAVATPGVRNRIVFQLKDSYVKESGVERMLANQRAEAESGDAAQQFTYGYTLGATRSFTVQMKNRDGDEVQIKGLDENANAWYERAAENNHPAAAYFLGLNTLQGRFCEKDSFKSAGWLYRAAMLGSAEAKYALAIEYLGGASFTKDETKGAFWLADAAETLVPAKLRYAKYLATAEDPARRDVALARSYLDEVDSDYVDELTYYEVAATVSAAEGKQKEALKWQKKAVAEAKYLDVPIEYYQDILQRYAQKAYSSQST
ncbi:TonB family protein [Gilvimarinus xylanilyticus]|uniref:TonB family protein n=1 Tax=Gilvimarinus xylanilyticus TaxID=2944139 RepID=A0A9X2HYL9_9GAMM|nr:TonB family protein [Gilvimarinus xylanilyticus]MCP8900430.1 TonB family protein [Gilvimarinus xylanilyticus]